MVPESRPSSAFAEARSFALMRRVSGASAGGNSPGAGGAPGGSSGATSAGTGGTISLSGSGGTGGQPPAGDPDTCEGAAKLKSYVGCDYWPTVTANAVWSVFDFAAIVVNAGTKPATVTVDRAGQAVGEPVVVEPDSIAKIYLPWIPELKGPDATPSGGASPLTKTVGAIGAAYHLVSDRPVSVYQFNALEYEGKGGPPGKSWANCPGNSTGIGCFSFSNDASLLLPTAALTGDYRVSVPRSFASALGTGIGSFFSITGTENSTTVKVQLSATGKTFAGAGIAAKGPGDVVEFKINQGDVLQLMGQPDSDLSGSLVQADRPVQVIAGNPCTTVPDQTTAACDHLEESVLPAQTLGKRYFVSPLTGPKGNRIAQQVRLLGNVDGTQLTYRGTKPAKAPATIDAGQLVDLGLITDAFEIEGDHEFLVTMFTPSGTIVDPQGSKGDPSMSVSVAVEQYRERYIFLGPDDYDINIADVIAPAGAVVTLDGQPAAGTPTPIAGTDFVIHRLALGPGQDGAHTLEADKPVGLQVMGYGAATSYQYPGGANLAPIAPPPPPIIE